MIKKLATLSSPFILAIVFLIFSADLAFAQVSFTGRVLNQNNWPNGSQIPQVIFRWPGGCSAPAQEYPGGAIIEIQKLEAPWNFGSIGNNQCNGGGAFFSTLPTTMPYGNYRIRLVTMPPTGYDFYSIGGAGSNITGMTDVWGNNVPLTVNNFDGSDVFSPIVNSINIVTNTPPFGYDHVINFGLNRSPAAPQNLSVATTYGGAPAVPNGVNFSWTDLSRAETSYIIRRLDVSGSTILGQWTIPANSTSFAIGGVCDGVTYRYSATGYNGTYNLYSAESPINYTCYGAAAPPNPLNAVCNVAGNQVTLSWNPTAGASSYNIATSGLGTTSTGGNSLVLNITPSVNYTSTIYAVNPVGFQSPTGTARNYTCTPPPGPPLPTAPPPPLPIPLPVTGMTYTCNAASTVANVSWTPSAGATSYDYRVDRQIDPWTGVCPLTSGTGGDICGNQAGTTMAVGVNPNTPYNMWVHARNASGGSGATNMAINCALVLPPTTPTNPRTVESPDPNVTTTLPTGVQFLWNDVTGETGYRVRIYNGDNGQIGPTITLPANTTSYLDTTIACGSPNRRYVVESFNGAGTSGTAQAYGSCRTVGFATSGTLAVSGSVSGAPIPDIVLNGSITNLNLVGGRDSTAQLIYDITAQAPGAVSGQMVTENRIVRGNQAINDRIAWPFVKTSPSDPGVTATSVQVSARLVSSSGATISGPVTFTLNWAAGSSYSAVAEPTLPPLNSTGGSNNTKKELSVTPPNFSGGPGGGFNDVTSPPTSLVVGSDYWVKLQVDGSNFNTTSSTSTGSDVMLVLDVTGSMSSKIPLGGGSSGSGYTTRIAAAKLALTRFLNDMRDDDRIGLASFGYCIPREQRYVNNMVLWGYEGVDNSMGAPVGYSYVHVGMNDATTAHKNLIREFLDTDGDRDLISGGGFCNNKFSGAATDLGGGLSGGLSLLTNLIQGQTRAAGSSYSNSLAGNLATNVPPSYRAGIPKYMVIATDGQENAYPEANDAQPLYTQRFSGTRTAVEYAMPATTGNPERKDIKVYTLTIGQQDDPVKNNLIDISRRTKGVFFLGETQEQLITSYTRIAREIQQISTSAQITVNEAINDTNFRIQGLDATNYRSNFYMSKYVLENGAYVEKDLTNDLCGGYSDCITQTTANTRYAFKMPVFPTNERYSLYFKVQAIAPPVVKGDLVDVDNSSSNVVDPSGSTRQLDNKQVLITTPDPFFLSSGADVYSGGQISSALLVLTETFLQQGTDMIMTKESSVDVANGRISPRSPAHRVLYMYPSNSEISYDTLYSLYQSKTEEIRALNGRIQFNGGVLTSDNPYYEVDVGSAGTNRLYLDAIDIGNTPTNRKPKVLFVDGDVYLTGNITVAKDGTSAFILIVNGNVGIDPVVTSVQGIYIVQQTFDTACVRASGFVAGACAPAITALNNTLDLEGSFYAIEPNGRFLLERKGNTSLVNRIPGEEFFYRPDFIMSTINTLGRPVFSWKEIND